MITVVVASGERGNLVSVAATGHAGKGKPGEDIVCSSVTTLLRTTMTVLAESGLDLRAETAGRGSLAFRVTAFNEADIPLLTYAAAFLREGLGSLEREYPEAVAMKVEDARLAKLNELLED